MTHVRRALRPPVGSAVGAATLVVLIACGATTAGAQRTGSEGLSLTPRVGVLLPTTTLGPWLSAHARMAPGVSVGLEAAIPIGSVLAARAVTDIALGVGPRVHGSDCTLDCRSDREYAGAMLTAVADLMARSAVAGRWRFRGAAGGGIKAYLYPTSGSDCRIGEDVCLAMAHFTESGVDPTLHLAAAATRSGGRYAVVLELGDYVSRYRGERVQHDLLLSVGIRRQRR